MPKIFAITCRTRNLRFIKNRKNPDLPNLRFNGTAALGKTFLLHVKFRLITPKTNRNTALPPLNIRLFHNLINTVLHVTLSENSFGTTRNKSESIKRLFVIVRFVGNIKRGAILRVLYYD